MVREDARARLLAQVCTGLTSARCAGIARHVRDWEAGDPADGAVCASAAVRREQVSTLETAAAQLDTDIAALAAAEKAEQAERDQRLRAETAELESAGLLEGSAEALASAARIFAGPQPWMPDHF